MTHKLAIWLAKRWWWLGNFGFRKGTMSICSWGDNSDVLIYWSAGGVTCCECTLPEFIKDAEVVLATIVDALEHLAQHIKAGHKVPQYAFDELRGNYGT